MLRWARRPTRTPQAPPGAGRTDEGVPAGDGADDPGAAAPERAGEGQGADAPVPATGPSEESPTAGTPDLWEALAALGVGLDGGGLASDEAGSSGEDARAAWDANVNRLRARATVADVLVRATSVEDSGVGQQLCSELVSQCGLRGAMAATFVGTRALSVAGAEGVFSDPDVQARLGARDAVARLHDRLSQGPALVPSDMFPAQSGLVVAVAPVSDRTRLLGAVLLAAPEGGDQAARAATLVTATELAEAGGPVLARPLQGTHAEAGRRARLDQLLEPGAFTPHFQPILELGSRRTIGYEALTRWHDRTRPDDVVAEAHALGIGAHVEVTLAAAATEHAKLLPPGRYLALNFSPSTVLTRPDIALLLPQDRPVVIEVTENERVDDHEALARALARLGANVHSAVDDAGASYASLRHIVTMRPLCVKLDIYWITDLEGDPARQAVLAGLVHLSYKLGCYLVAEGVERESELLALRQLGITHGQGRLLGAPRPASELERHTSAV